MFPALHGLSRGRRAGTLASARARGQGGDLDVHGRLSALLGDTAPLHALFDAAPVGRAFVDMDGLITDANQALADLVGYPVPELVGRPILELVAPEDRDRARLDADSLLDGHVRRTSSVARCLHRRGYQAPIRVYTSLLAGADGDPVGWASVMVDLAEEERARLQAQQAQAVALASAERLRLLHAVATAANDADRLESMAPHALRATCVCFGWRAGALLRWTGPGPDVLAAPGPEDWSAFGDLDPPRTTRPALALHGGRPVVLVPLSAGGAVLALAFAVPRRDASVPADVLTLVAGECLRVLEREAAERHLRESEERFRSVFDASPLPMSITPAGTRVFAAVNDALCHLVGRDRDELIGHPIEVFLHPDDVAAADAAGLAAASSPTGRHTAELRYVRASGAIIVVEVALAWVDGPDGDRVMLAQTVDITARREAEEALRAQAETDTLTGLANRFRLVRVLAETEDVAGCAVLFIDVDSFKLINDTRGQEVGDEVLVEIAERLRGAAGPGDLPARFGGDEFVVVSWAGSAHGLADRIEAAIATSAGTTFVTASIGICDGASAATAGGLDLLQRADAAMSDAKRLGKDRQAVYDDRLHRKAVEYQRTEALMRNALDENRFVVHYQPIVTLGGAQIVGFEALVRLRDEQGRLVPPGKFIHVAEQSGLIVPMGAWVLAESCRQVAALSRRLGRSLSVSVNVAARQAARSDLAATVAAALDGAGLLPAALTLELTESVLLDADEATMRQLGDLRERGVLVGLDDFGTGYSSLTYLRQLPVSHVKVDRSFVTDMTDDRGNASIVRAVTGLAEELGLFWVAEGVETAAVRDALALLGPGLAQGYLFGRPMPVGALPGLFAGTPN